MTALAIARRDQIDLPGIVRRYAEGESMQVLAAENGVHRATLYRWMLAGIGDGQYDQLVTHCLVQRIADSDEELDRADNACDIARAREKARFARMDLERRRPHLYGQKQHVTLDVAGDLGERLMRARERAVAEQQSQKSLTDQGADSADSSVIP